MRLVRQGPPASGPSKPQTRKATAVGFIDDAKNKLSDAVDQHGDKLAAGLDQAAEAIDAKTGGKHTDKIEAGVDKAKDVLDGLDGRNDDIR